MNFNIAQPFFESARKYPQKPAVVADGKSYSYQEMLEAVTRVAEWLSRGDHGAPKRVGIFASRSMEACVGILASAWVGAAYVPINLKQPESGVIGLLQRSGLDALVVDGSGSQMLTTPVLEQAPFKTLCVREHVPRNGIEGLTYFDALPGVRSVHGPVMMAADAIAYILHTSGSTGIPKGVMLPTGAVNDFLSAMEKDYPLSSEDKTAETADTSFDISVYDMFATWRAGGSLHIIPRTQVMAPAKFIADHGITVWFSVPSIAALMSRMGLLKPGRFSSLRLTFFCGEPLLASVAEAWHQAAPNSLLVNMYGPTEATVMCMGQIYDEKSVLTRDSVAIGRPFTNTQAAIAKNAGELAAPGVQGELLLAGPQLALGYLDDPEKTARQFVAINGMRWYRTGDLAYCDDHGIFHYLGRVDNQVKIFGYRVELEEIECHLRDSTGCADVAAVAWPQHGGSASGVVGFLVKPEGSEESIRTALQGRLPSYMVPTKIHFVSTLPVNSNGKIDRGALLKMLDQGVLG